MGAWTNVTFDVGDEYITELKPRLRSDVPLFDGDVGIDRRGNLSVHLNRRDLDRAVELLESHLPTGEYAAVMILNDTTDSGTGYVYRKGEDLTAVVDERLGDQMEMGSDVADEIEAEFGFRPLVDSFELRSLIRRRYGDDVYKVEKLVFFAQKLAKAADPDTSLTVDDVRGEPIWMMDYMAENEFADHQELRSAIDERDWERVLEIAETLTDRPLVEYS